MAQDDNHKRNDLEAELSAIEGVTDSVEAQSEKDSKKTTASKWALPGMILLFVFGKLKWLLAIAKFLKFGTLISMALMVWVYAQFWGVWFAFGFILLILIHELGHGVAMKYQGIPAGAPIFIPFFGAVIAMKGRPKDVYVEAVVGIGGPLLGTFGALVCLPLGFLTKNQMFFALASTGFLINLFNMIPISPLDGGRIIGALTRWLWGVGFALAIGLAFVTRSPILIFIIVMGLFSLPRLLRPQDESYYRISKSKRVNMALGYFWLLGVLVFGMRYADSLISEVNRETVQMGMTAILLQIGKMKLIGPAEKAQ